MKKTFYLLLACLLYGSTIFAYAKTGNIDDHRVNYIYWDQPEIQTYWTGVTNKISYDHYAPCVGADGAGMEYFEFPSLNNSKE